MKTQRRCCGWLSFLLLCAQIDPILRADELTNSIAELKRLSLEELMNQEVTTASRRPELLSESPSAIQVIRGDDIRRSGALTLAEALRLAPNLQVAQQTAHDWAITARGFNGAPLNNNTLADKLLVMIDGRSIYTPLFGGVFWDAQQVLLEDIDRIEVVSGPGTSLWGENAVNGVINVVTKSARDTQGLFLSGEAGSFMQDAGGLRYGASVGTNLFYRVYVQRFDHDPSTTNHVDAHDDWAMTQGGFRLDYYHSSSDRLTIQGDFYENSENRPVDTRLNGENVLGRWTKTFAEQNELSIQTYFDRTFRNFETPDLTEELLTFDFDFQHHLPLGNRQELTWGGNYRRYDDRVQNSPIISFDPAERTLELYGGFVQDEIALWPDVLKLTLGTKVEHNDYTGLEVQPTARLAWIPTSRQTIWAAISRAVRTPTRLEVDEVSAGLGTPNHAFESEKVISYELGYRVRPRDELSISLAGFYNTYDELRSLNLNRQPPPLLIFANDQEATTYGFELSADFRPWQWWRWRGGYTYLETDLHATTPAVVRGSEVFEAIDPHHQLMLQSIMDLPHHLQLDAVGRYVSELPGIGTSVPAVPEYLTFDVRVAWVYRNVELALIGQNLAQPEHREFSTHEVPRAVFGKVSLRF